jgi:hypothetical protein
MPSKKNQQNYWFLNPSEPFTIALFNARHPVDLKYYLMGKGSKSGTNIQTDIDKLLYR